MDFTLISSFLEQYHVLAIFIGSFLFGESVIIAAAFLSGQGQWSPEMVFFVGLLGTVISDSVWYGLGQYFLRGPRWEKYYQKNERLIIGVEKFLGKRPFLLLLFFKFLYGTRILMIVYLSVKKLSYRIFLLFDTLGTMIWLFAMIGIGFLAGRGSANLIPYINRFEIAFSAIVVLILVIKLFTLWINKRLIK